MKAIVYTEYGAPDVLHLQEVEKPTPKAHEVLIKVHAATVTAGDVNIRGFTFVPPGFGFLPRVMFGLRKPRKPILGIEAAGEVAAVGSAVTLFKPGDQVFGSSAMRLGAYAEYVCWPENRALALKPANLTYEEAAALSFGGLTSLYFLRDKARLQPGQKVLIIGASGGVGTAMVQIARYYGAEVTGVCSTPNLELVKSLGADYVVDYTQEDVTKNGKTYDVIADTVCGKASFVRYKNSLKPNGLYLAVAGGPREMWQTLTTSIRGGKKVISGTGGENNENLNFLRELTEAGHFKPFIDKTFPLEQIVEAHRHADTGRKRGNVAIKVQQP
jgi:NADPH:quinone reductase-like Zn-dependent oxidoreductase